MIKLKTVLLLDSKGHILGLNCGIWIAHWPKLSSLIISLLLICSYALLRF